MGTLTTTESREGSTLLLTLTGDLDSQTALVTLELDGVSEIRINFEGLGYINSTGIAGWIHWVRAIEMNTPPPQVILEEVSPLFVRILMSVKDLVPDRWKIGSMVASYFCPSCNQATARLITDLKKWANSSEKEPQALLYHECSECRAVIELDDFISRYMEVIRKYA